MQKFKYIFFTLIIFAVFSCQTVVEDIKLPYEERLVIQSFISPQDTLLEVRVSKTRPVVGTFPLNQSYGLGYGSYQPIEGATVEISDGNRKGIFQLQTIVNPLSFENDPNTGKVVPQSRRSYFLRAKDFPVIPGHTYTLTAKAPNLPDVTASCTVPKLQLLNGKDFSILKGKTIDSLLSYSIYNNGKTYNYFDISRRFDVQIKDFINEENYYAVAYYTRKVYQSKDEKGIFQSVTSTRQEGYSDFISDYKQDGKLLNFRKANIPLGSYSDSPNQQPNVETKTQFHIISIFIAITDKPYYQYNKALGNSQGINNDDPFSEAILTYTNINGGLGVFAGYNMTEIQFDLLK